MASYFRDCRFCGRRIQMREMGPRRWVPFEHGKVHACSSPVDSVTIDRKAAGTAALFRRVLRSLVRIEVRKALAKALAVKVQSGRRWRPYG